MTHSASDTTRGLIDFSVEIKLPATK